MGILMTDTREYRGFTVRRLFDPSTLAQAETQLLVKHACADSVENYVDYYAERQDGIIRHDADQFERLDREFQIRWLRDVLGLAPDADVLDYGCGTASAGKHIAAYLEAGRYVGVDISPISIERGRAVLAGHGLADKRPELLVIPGGDLSALGERRFDIIWAQSVFTHLPPEIIETVLAGLRVHLKPGGAVYASVTLASEGEGVLQVAPHNWFQEPEALAACGRAGGYVMERMEGWSHPYSGANTSALMRFTPEAPGEMAADGAPGPSRRHALRVQGYSVLKDIYPPATAAAARSAVEEIFADDTLDRSLGDSEHVRNNCLVRFPALSDLLVTDELLSGLRAILGEGGYILPVNALCRDRYSTWHKDVHGLEKRGYDFQWSVADLGLYTVIIYQQSGGPGRGGGLDIIPGSHRQADRYSYRAGDGGRVALGSLAYEPSRVLSLATGARDATVFDARCDHRGSWPEAWGPHDQGIHQDPELRKYLLSFKIMRKSPLVADYMGYFIRLAEELPDFQYLMTARPPQALADRCRAFGLRFLDMAEFLPSAATTK